MESNRLAIWCEFEGEGERDKPRMRPECLAWGAGQSPPQDLCIYRSLCIQCSFPRIPVGLARSGPCSNAALSERLLQPLDSVVFNQLTPNQCPNLQPSSWHPILLTSALAHSTRQHLTFYRFVCSTAFLSPWEWEFPESSKVFYFVPCLILSIWHTSQNTVALNIFCLKIKFIKIGNGTRENAKVVRKNTHSPVFLILSFRSSLVFQLTTV